MVSLESGHHHHHLVCTAHMYTIQWISEPTPECILLLIWMEPHTPSKPQTQKRSFSQNINQMDAIAMLVCGIHTHTHSPHKQYSPKNKEETKPPRPTNQLANYRKSEQLPGIVTIVWCFSSKGRHRQSDFEPSDRAWAEAALAKTPFGRLCPSSTFSSIFFGLVIENDCLKVLRPPNLACRFQFRFWVRPEWAAPNGTAQLVRDGSPLDIVPAAVVHRWCLFPDLVSSKFVH